METLLKICFSKEVKFKFWLSITIESIKRTPHTRIAPYEMITQQTIDISTNIIDKHQAAHNQSFQCLSKKSVNDRVQRDALLEHIYSDALKRIIYYIHSIR